MGLATRWFSTRSLLVVVATFAFLIKPDLVVADWPTYQHDPARSGATDELAPSNPKSAWVYTTPTRPRAAWDEPALWDGWSKTHDLQNRQVFDKAVQVAIADGRVYFGSSVDDQVYCKDLATGEVIWRFYTEAPVRMAPTIANGHVYVGSDDGFVYCLKADDASVVWKYRAGDSNRRVAGNGRVISPWAIRTSVAVIGDTAYCGAGVIPSEGVYVCALDTATGQERWKTKMNDLPAQGYLLASQTRLYVVTSRDTPVVFDGKTGERLHKVGAGTGGTYALLTGDTLIYGPSKTGEVNMVGESQDVLASFKGNHMIVAKPYSYLHSREELSALDRSEYVRLYGVRVRVGKELGKKKDALKKIADDETKKDAAEALQAEVEALTKEHESLSEQLTACLKWRVECKAPYALVLANNLLIAGGDGTVAAFDATTGEAAWELDVPGKVYGLAVSDGSLLVSTDEGTVHCYRDNVETPANNVPPRVAVATPVRLQEYAGPPTGPETQPAEIFGPFTELIAPGKLRIRWDTTVPMTSMVHFGVNLESPQKYTSEQLTMQHEVLVEGVQREVVFGYQIGGTTQQGREVVTETYRFDSYLDYLPSQAPDRPSPYPASDRDADYRAVARQLIDVAGATRGYVLMLGAEDGLLAYELARQSDLQIVIVEPNAERAREVRERFHEAGYYGHRVSVHVGDFSDLPYGPFLANIITSESALVHGTLEADLNQVYRCLRPAGGVLALATLPSIKLANVEPWQEELSWESPETSGGDFMFHRRPMLSGVGEWTHQYGSADNSACSKDEMIRGKMMVQWWGRPGARPMPDRGNRNPAPVSANGRLYVQGNRTLFGLDAYNGAILWAKQIPTMRRANMPRDVSNMVAYGDQLWVAIGNKVVAFDGQTGERQRNIETQNFDEEREYDWGYISQQGSQLIGSSVRQGSHYMGDKGEWYQGKDDATISRVTSDGVFSLNVFSGATQWRYSEGVVINSTITIADGRMFLIESRNQAAKKAKDGRMLREVLDDTYLVALDAESGKKLWEKQFDFSGCRYMTYVTHGDGTVLVTGSDEDETFHTYGFDAASGEHLWEHEAKDKKGHHTGQLAHPTIVGPLVYFNKHTYELRTGKVLGVHDFNWHGCGVMSASNHTVFSRYEYHGMLDLETKERTEFLGIRSGCWLSLIPSGGLLLAPETSAGCSCGHSLQTSIAYVPQSLADAAGEDRTTTE